MPPAAFSTTNTGIDGLMMPAIGPTAPWWWHGSNATSPAAGQRSARARRSGPSPRTGWRRRSRRASARTCRFQSIGGPACSSAAAPRRWPAARRPRARRRPARLRGEVARRRPRCSRPRRCGSPISARGPGRRVGRPRRRRPVELRDVPPARARWRRRSRRPRRSATERVLRAELPSSPRHRRARSRHRRRPAPPRALLGASITPAARSLASCRRGPGGPRRCRRRSRRWRACGPRARPPRLRDRRRQLAGRVGVRAVAEHDVEQDHGDPRVGGLPQQPLVAQAWSIIGCGRPRVNRSSPRSISVWPSLRQRVRQPRCGIDRGVRRRLASREQQRGLVAERAAAKEAAHEIMLARERSRRAARRTSGA